MNPLNLKHLLVFAMCAACTAQPVPSQFPVSLSSAGAVEQKLIIEGTGIYKIEFEFSRSGMAFDEMKKLIGAMHVCRIAEPCPTGVVIPVIWSIKSAQTGRVVASGQVETIDSSGWSQASVSRYIGSAALDRGDYKFRIEILRGVPELVNLKTTVAIRLPLK